MERPPPDRHDYLRRLQAERYLGRAAVHWSMTVHGRGTGWLSAAFHFAWREVLLHTVVRYRVAIPAYCLMPDHAHILMTGLSGQSDQRRAVSFLRRYTQPLLQTHGLRWQRQAYDHVLREQERAADAFRKVATYVVENPVRAGLVASAALWPYGGSLLGGWPDLDWRREDFWRRWWDIYAADGGTEAVPLPAGPSRRIP